MELKSKISTSIEQSKKLLELGLKPDTADMVYHCDRTGLWSLEARPIMQKSRSLFYKVLKYQHGEAEANKIFKQQYDKDVPAWSLSRLIELMPEEIKDKKHGESFYLTMDKEDNSVSYINEYPELKLLAYTSNPFVGRSLFDSLIEMIDWLINNDYLNKEHLCNK